MLYVSASGVSAQTVLPDVRSHRGRATPHRDSRRIRWLDLGSPGMVKDDPKKGPECWAAEWQPKKGSKCLDAAQWPQ